QDLLLLVQMWIEGVSQGVEEDENAEDGDDDRDTRRDDHPPGAVEVVERVAEHIAPACRGDLDAEAQVAQSGLAKDGAADTEARDHEHDGEDVRENMAV